MIKKITWVIISWIGLILIINFSPIGSPQNYLSKQINAQRNASIEFGFTAANKTLDKAQNATNSALFNLLIVPLPTSSTVYSSFFYSPKQ